MSANKNTNLVQHSVETTNSTAAAALEDAFAAALREFSSDPAFPSAMANLDTDKVAKGNTFHRMERRLWPITLGKASAPQDLETSHKQNVTQPPTHTDKRWRASMVVWKHFNILDRTRKFKNGSFGYAEPH